MWNCVDGVCTGEAPIEGKLEFTDLPDYNAFGPHKFPLDPDTCYVAVLQENDGLSPPPYTEICRSDEFNTPP